MRTPRRMFILPVLVVLGVVLVLAACAGSDVTALPETTSGSVLAYLEEVDYQNNDEWKLFPGSTEKYPGTDPHGMLLTTYVNPAAFEAIEDGATTPSGLDLGQGELLPRGEISAPLR